MRVLFYGDGLRFEVDRDFVKVNNVAVTGDFFYPVDIVKKNLGLMNVSGLKGKTVVSLGEGFSGLLPYLLENQVSAFGVDIWYHNEAFPTNMSGIKMRE